MKTLKRFLRDERGTEVVEWGIILGVLIVLSIGLILGLGGWVSSQFQLLADKLGFAAQ